MVDNPPDKDAVMEMSHMKNTENLDIDERQFDSKLNVSDSEEQIQGEQFVISEYQSSDNYFSVVITDSHGVHIFEKGGHMGETVELELMGQTISYLISGNNEDGSVRQVSWFYFVVSRVYAIILASIGRLYLMIFDDNRL